MKYNKPAIAILIAMGLPLTGCGSSNDKETKTPEVPVVTQAISGIVSDPAIVGAEVMVFDGKGDKTSFSAITDASGNFTISGLPEGDLSNYRLVTSGGVDTTTGQSFKTIQLAAPLAVFSDTKKLVVSPFTSLLDAKITAGSAASDVIAQLKAKLADVDLLADPSQDKATQRLALKLSLLLAQGFDAKSIVSALDDEAGISQTDLDSIYDDKKAESQVRTWQTFERLTAADDQAKQSATFQKSIILSVLLDAAKIKLSADEPMADLVLTNLNKLVAHYYQLAQSKSENKYITTEEVIASLAASGSVSTEMLAKEDFKTDKFKLVKVATDATFTDSLKLAFYALDNPVTGNKQLVVHDTTTNKQQVIKTNIILGSRAFIFNGVKDGDKSTYQGHAYGIFLDPNQSFETRTAASGRGGQFEYSFYFDNAFKAYNVAKPADERIIFSSDKFNQQLKSQGMKALAASYRVVDNLVDVENSYVELTAYEKLADPLKAEKANMINHVPLTVRLSDGAHTLGHITALLKNEQGKTAKVLVSYEAVHKSGSYPAAEAERTRLQLCETDLKSCNDVTKAGEIGDGSFYFQSESTSHIYLTKKGSADYFAFVKADNSLAKVSGVKYPAKFNPSHHLIGAGGHGGSGLLSNFSSLPNATTNLSEGDSAYLAVNYDLDTKDPLGKYKYLGNIYAHKNAQVIKFNGLTGVKMYDTADGIDLGDTSDAKPAKGHINLIAALNGKLFIEQGNYDGTSAGGDCEPSASGYYCSSVAYGVLEQDSINKSSFDIEITHQENLRYLLARRLAPYAINGDLYINLVSKEGSYGGIGHQYTLSRYDTDSVQIISQVQGRSYFTLSAKYDDGRMEGQVIAWDAATNKLVNVTTSKIIVANLAADLGKGAALSSVFATSNGLPLAGLGNIFALHADPGGHQWYLQAGSLEGEGSVDTIDKLPGSTWLYY